MNILYIVSGIIIYIYIYIDMYDTPESLGALRAFKDSFGPKRFCDRKCD